MIRKRSSFRGAALLAAFIALLAMAVALGTTSGAGRPEHVPADWVQEEPNKWCEPISAAAEGQFDQMCVIVQ
jgi:hypothetical protein